MYIKVDAQACTSVSFDITGTQVADSEKAIAHIALSDLELAFTDRFPSAPDYKPMLIPKEIVHRLSNGGVKVNRLDEKYRCQIKLNDISTSFRDSLLGIYRNQNELLFTAFETMTGWDEVFFQCRWVGNFDFLKFSDNVGIRHKGKMDLREVAL